MVGRLIDSNGRVGIVDQVRDTGVFAHPAGVDYVIRRDGSDCMTATFWSRQEDGSLRGLWYDSPAGGFVNGVIK